MRPELPATAAIVGAGYMGTGIAQVLARAGVECRLADVSPAAAAAGAERVARESGDAALAARVVPAGDLAAAVAGAGLVIEATSEDPAVKAAVLEAIEAAAPADAVIATNTSAIPIARLAGPLRRPERFLGAHWFNPPQLVPCVEVIPGPATDPAVVDWITGVLRAVGKTAVAVGDGPGFVGNRIQFAMFREAAAVVAEGLATPEAVDEIVRTSFGYRLPFVGPFAVADMAGLDVYAGAYAALEQELGAAFAAPEALSALVAEGKLGTKSGGGFLGLDAAAAERLRTRRDAGYEGLARLLEELG